MKVGRASDDLETMIEDPALAQALRRKGISTLHELKHMGTWAEENTRNTLATNVKLNALQIGDCMEIIRRKHGKIKRKASY